METEYLLNVSIDIATAEFESFCSQGFSLSSLVQSKRLKSATPLIQFKLELIAGEGPEDAKIEFKPAPAGLSILDFNPSYARSGTILQDGGLIISEMLFWDFVLYLGQREYLQGSSNSANEPRKRLMTELRDLVGELPRHVSDLRAKYQKERDSFPAEGAPDLKKLHNGLMSLGQRIEQGNLDELIDTLKWYLDTYAEFPQLVAAGTPPRDKRDRTLQLAAPGRPRDSAYDVAADLIKRGEKDYKEAFEGFCQSQGITNPDKYVRDSFKAAMKRRHINS